MAHNIINKLMCVSNLECTVPRPRLFKSWAVLFAWHKKLNKWRASAKKVTDVALRNRTLIRRPKEYATPLFQVLGSWLLWEKCSASFGMDTWLQNTPCAHYRSNSLLEFGAPPVTRNSWGCGSSDLIYRISVVAYRIGPNSQKTVVKFVAQLRRKDGTSPRSGIKLRSLKRGEKWWEQALFGMRLSKLQPYYGVDIS